MTRHLACLLAATALAGTAALPAAAQDLEPVSLTVVGTWSGLPLHRLYELPFWTETVPEASGGAITVELTTFDQMGVGGGDVFRLLSDGVFDIGATVADYTVADAPELEGLDVPLVATDADGARAMVDAARPMVADIMADRFNSHLLAIAPYPPQIVFCNADISGGLGDLQDLRVRASGRMTAQLLEALGAEGITLAFSEVPAALERGVIDCAITGSGSGYSAGWYESATHVMPLPLGGWDAVVTAMNMDAWNALPEATQAFLTDIIATEFEAPAWDEATSSLQNDLNCLTGSGECTSGEPASMILVEASDADRELARAALEETVLPDWAERAGADWAARWNESVGAVVGVTVPVE
ncbi:MAG: TRAP transporter substrate-binding protein [Rhodospirillaceae bacterium]|nr:TRAP transporter substrate-binding protein [Rhodospirillaceae bacterium]